jgi:hypothetical protein
MRKDTAKMETTEYKGYTIKIEQDDEPTDPRSWDNLGTMICFHPNYNLGDTHDLKPANFRSAKRIEEYIEKKLKGHIILPLYLYDHSGITMNTTGFSCRWDSGLVGFIYITAKKIRHEYNAKRISKKLKERVSGYLVNEVKEYDQFLTGDVWGYRDIEDPDGNVLDDSCWGFFGIEHCITEAESIVDEDIKIKKELKKVETTPLKKLPLLIGSLEYEVSRKRLEERLKGE